MGFNHYLEDEDDKPYFSVNSLAYYYDKMAEKEKLIKELSKEIKEYDQIMMESINANKETLLNVITQNENTLQQLSGLWDEKMQSFDDGVKDLLVKWVDDGTIDKIVDAEVMEKIDGKASMTEMLRVSSPYEYGELKFPSDFPKVPVKFRRDPDGIVRHSFDFEKYHKSEKVLYVDFEKGNDTSDGSSSTPYKTLRKALTTVSTLPEKNIKIVCRSYFFARDEHFTSEEYNIRDKYLSIVPEDKSKKIEITTHQRGLTWANVSERTYKTARSSVQMVIDKNVKDAYGTYIPLPFVKSPEEVINTPGSWYTDNVDIWVHLSDGRKPTDNDFFMSLELAQSNITMRLDSRLYMENVDVYSGRVSNAFYIVEAIGEVGSTFIANNCRFVGGAFRNLTNAGGNAISVSNIETTLLFNCIAAYANLDGFNYHYAGVPVERRKKCLAIEYNCISYNNGLRTDRTSCNATTCHEGTAILRIGSVGYSTHGPVLADVNGCYSIVIDCHMRDSLLSAGEVNSAFYFDNVLATTPGKAILINSSGQGDNYSLNTDGTMEVILQNFKGPIIGGKVNPTII